jgi:serine/threonine protein kinase
VRLVGEPLPGHMTQPVYAYAKFRGLETQGQQERLLYTSLATARRQGNLAPVQELLPKAEKARKARASIQAQIEEEVSIAKEVGANVAVLMEIQRKLSNPEAIKGGEMECWDTNLARFLYRPLHSQERIRIAHCACSLVEALHYRKILHLDVKSGNFLCRTRGNRVELRLADFGAAKRNCYGQPYKQHVCTFRPPETVMTTSAQPVLGPHLDAWGLGITVFEIMCRGHNLCRIINKAGEPQKQEAVLKTIDEYEKKSGRPQVAAVLRGLLDFSPQTRWSAQQAKEALSVL